MARIDPDSGNPVWRQTRCLGHHGVMLIDRFAPSSNFRGRHEIVVHSEADRVLDAIKTVDFKRSGLIRLLFTLRGMGGRGRLAFDDFLRFGFVLLDEDPGVELVLGVTGKFWRPDGDIRRVVADEFAGFAEPGYVKAAWNFHVQATGPHRCLLSTETRIVATDQAALRSFRPYWLVVRPFSGLIRRRMLALVRRAGETGR